MLVLQAGHVSGGIRGELPHAGLPQIHPPGFMAGGVAATGASVLLLLIPRGEHSGGGSPPGHSVSRCTDIR